MAVLLVQGVCALAHARSTDPHHLADSLPPLRLACFFRETTVSAPGDDLGITTRMESIPREGTPTLFVRFRCQAARTDDDDDDTTATTFDGRRSRPPHVCDGYRNMERLYREANLGLETVFGEESSAALPLPQLLFHSVGTRAPDQPERYSGRIHPALLGRDLGARRNVRSLLQ